MFRERTKIYRFCFAVLFPALKNRQSFDRLFNYIFGLESYFSLQCYLIREQWEGWSTSLKISRDQEAMQKKLHSTQEVFLLTEISARLYSSSINNIDSQKKQII